MLPPLRARLPGGPFPPAPFSAPAAGCRHGGLAMLILRHSQIVMTVVEVYCEVPLAKTGSAQAARHALCRWGDRLADGRR